MKNGFNCDFFINIEKEVLYILDRFWIISSSMMIEFDKREDGKKNIFDYLRKSRNFLSLPWNSFPSIRRLKLLWRPFRNTKGNSGSLVLAKERVIEKEE